MLLTHRQDASKLKVKTSFTRTAGTLAHGGGVVKGCSAGLLGWAAQRARKRRKRRLLPTTETLDKPIAMAA